MRPQDIVILLKVVAKEGVSWQFKDLAMDLHMSSSEVTESLNRSRIASLIDTSRKKVFVNALFDFLVYGLRYVFPAQPGSLTRGMLTGHSSPVFRGKVIAEERFVWPFTEGKFKGQSIEPLYSTVPKAASQDEKLYELLALADVFRVGKAREIKIAKGLLLKKLRGALHEPSY